jgi:hypothetical protein
VKMKLEIGKENTLKVIEKEVMEMLEMI